MHCQGGRYPGRFQKNTANSSRANDNDQPGLEVAVLTEADLHQDRKSTENYKKVKQHRGEACCLPPPFQPAWIAQFTDIAAMIEMETTAPGNENPQALRQTGVRCKPGSRFRCGADFGG